MPGVTQEQVAEMIRAAVERERLEAKRAEFFRRAKAILDDHSNPNWGRDIWQLRIDLGL